MRHVKVAIFVGNEGNVKVFLRNGFKMINILENYQEIRGKMRGLHVLEWRLTSTYPSREDLILIPATTDQSITLKSHIKTFKRS